MPKAIYFGQSVPKKSQYQQIEYIESTGTQYIDTMFIPNYNSRIIMTVSQVDDSTVSGLFGCRSTASATDANQFGVIIPSDKTQIRSDYFGTNVSMTVTDKSVMTTIDKNKNITTAYGQTITNTAKTSGECDYSAYIFAYNNIGTASSFAKYRLHRCQIYASGVLARDYIPVLDEDGVPCLYDKQRGVFTYNKGTGEFLAGEPVESLAMKGKKLYIGVDNVARTIKKAYVGVNGIARLWWSTFPDEATEYVLTVTYTKNTTFTAPATGWYQIELQGASGKGGTGSYHNYDYGEGTVGAGTALSSGGGGGGSGCAISRVKLKKDDTIVYTHATTGNTCKVVINSSVEDYTALQVTSGANGTDGNATLTNSAGSGGSGGSASGGQENYSGGRGSNGKYYDAEKNYNVTCNGGVGGTAGYTGGNAGGKGGNAGVKSGGTPYYDAGSSGKASFVKIYTGNTTVVE